MYLLAKSVWINVKQSTENWGHKVKYCSTIIDSMWRWVILTESYFHFWEPLLVSAFDSIISVYYNTYFEIVNVLWVRKMSKAAFLKLFIYFLFAPPPPPPPLFCLFFCMTGQTYRVNVFHYTYSAFCPLASSASSSLVYSQSTGRPLQVFWG